jgi:hypothetical protein
LLTVGEVHERFEDGIVGFSVRIIMQLGAVQGIDQNRVTAAKYDFGVWHVVDET